MTAELEQGRIGGFFELELPTSTGGFLGLWQISDDPNLSFALARSALAALIAALDPPTVWIPAYMCRSVPDQVRPDRLRYYPVGELLEPDLQHLVDAVAPGDLVVGMNYFGRPPKQAFRSFAESRPDVTFVEDCAQTIDTGVPPWGDFRIFSPRKLLGVPDGGIIVPIRSAAPASLRTVPDPDVESIAALFLRYEDSDGVRWRDWHEGHEAWLRGLQRSTRRMSRLTRTILGLTDPSAVARARFRNFAVLSERLRDVSYLDQPTGSDEAPRYVPFGFPIRLPPAIRDRVRARLWEAKVYAFRHFANLPSPVTQFRSEHALSGELITLPCDQRYTAREMEFMTDVVRAALIDD